MNTSTRRGQIFGAVTFPLVVGVVVFVGSWAARGLKALSPGDPALTTFLAYLIVLVVVLVVWACVIGVFRAGGVRQFIAHEREGIEDIQERGLDAYMADHDMQVAKPDAQTPRRVRLHHHGLFILIAVLFQCGFGALTWALISDDSRYIISPVVFAVLGILTLYHGIQFVRAWMQPGDATPPNDTP